MSLRILIIVPCGNAKIWDKNPNQGPTKARGAYVGPPFKVNKSFAEKFGDKWVVLSAKYGFIDPEFIIPENYNVTFKDPSTNPISLESLKDQLKVKNLHDYGVVIALGGRDYTQKIKKAFMNVSKVIAPTEGLNLFKMMKHVKSLLRLEKEEMLKRIGIS